MASPPPLQASQGSITSNRSASASTFVEPSLETLVNHLLASKRSLSTMDTVWRANEIVRSAQHALEESVVLSARTRFLQKNIADSTRILRRIRSGVEEVYKDGEVDFQTTLKSLDDADAQLKKTMDMLKTTIVESSLRPNGEEAKNLLDFVDPQGVDVTRAALKESIDLTQDAQAEFLDSIRTFEESLRAIKRTLKSTSTSQTLTSLPNFLTNLESHAHDMASLLSSLVSHFDMCVNAIKHTEGGLTAVHDMATEHPESADVAAAVESSSAALQPMPAAERYEMLSVLLKDAAEVDYVVLELTQLHGEMETSFAALTSHVATLKTDFDAATLAFALLEKLQATLPAYIASSATFRARWADEKAFIAAQMVQLTSIQEFYEAYLGSYDACLVEVERRREVEERKEAVLAKAIRECERLGREDEELREKFWGDNKEWLPADLWVGVGERARRWIVVEDDDRDAEREGEGNEIGAE